MPTYKLPMEVNIYQGPVMGKGYWNTAYIDEISSSGCEYVPEEKENQFNTSQKPVDTHNCSDQQDIQVYTRQRLKGLHDDSDQQEFTEQMQDKKFVNKQDEQEELRIKNEIISDENKVVFLHEDAVGKHVTGTGDVAPREDKDGGAETDASEEDNFPDGGWGYVVAFGAALISMTVAAVGVNFGILLSEFLLKLKTSSTMTSWIFNAFIFMWNFTSFLLVPISEIVGWRKTTFVGGVLCCLGLCLSAFVTSAPMLFFTYSICVGMGSGICMTVPYIIISHYFKRRRGRAMAILSGGFCLGGIVGPPIVTFLQGEFGYKGATLLCGAFSLNMCASAAVFHPVHWHTKKSAKPIEILKSQEPLTKTVVSETLKQVASNMRRNLRIIKSAQVVILGTSCILTFGGFIQVIGIIPFVMERRGFTQVEASWCMTISSMCNMVTRLTTSNLSDYSWFNMRICYMVGTVTVSLSILVFSLVWDMMMIHVALVAWGVGVGMTYSIGPLLAATIVGVDNFGPYLGVVGIVAAFWFLGTGPLLGAITDVTGSYIVTLNIQAAMVLLAFFLWLLMPLAIARDRRTEAWAKMGRMV